MSTPLGKPGPLDLSAYEPRRAREQVAAEPHPSEDKTDPLRSPYAPKRAHEPAGKERHPVENDRDPLRSPYAPTKARGQPAVAPDFGISDDAEPPPPMGAREGSSERPAAGRHTLGGGDHSPKTALEEGITAGHSVDRDVAAHPNSARDQTPAAERDEIMRDYDLKRLEASLRWLQRQEAATRLPRAAPLLSVPGLASVHTTGRHPNNEMLVDTLRAPHSLEPERLAPPFAMTSRRYNLRWSLGIVVASVFAAAIAYYFLVDSWNSPPELGPQIESLDQTVVTPQSKGAQNRAQQPEVSAPVEMSSERTDISQTTKSSESETGPMLQGGTGTQASSPGKVIRALDPEEIKLLTRQGEQFAAAGDLVTARILLQRAAEAGDATAAIALGATYDPNVLAKLGVVGMNADVEKARSWYRKAESFGSPDASQRLNALANR
jgi:hypothetical protein